MSDYTIKIDEENERVRFHGIDWGYGIGDELPLWHYYEHSGLVIVKKVGSSHWSGLAQPASYSPAEFMVLRITEPREGMKGWVRVEKIISFPIRKSRSAS